jgi:hypothetical protein
MVLARLVARAVTSVDAMAQSSPPDRGDDWTYRPFYREAMPRLIAFLLIGGAALPEAAGYAQEALIDAHREWSVIGNAYRWCRLEVYGQLARHRDRHTDLLGTRVALGGATLIDPDGAPADWLRDHHGLLRSLDLLPRLERDVFAWAYDGGASWRSRRPSGSPLRASATASVVRAPGWSATWTADTASERRGRSGSRCPPGRGRSG